MSFWLTLSEHHMRPTLCRKHRLFSALALLGLSVLFGNSVAQAQPWYKVEMIVFSQARGEYINAQQWPEIETPAWLDAVPLQHAPPSQYKPLGGLNKLRGAKNKLDESGRYRVLFAGAWTQAGKQTILPIKIQSDKQFDVPVKKISIIQTEMNADTGSKEKLIQKPELEGTIQMILSRFLHFKTDLIYRAPVTGYVVDDASTQTKINQLQLADALQGDAYLQSFRLNAKRKMRSRRTYHLDHPMFGVLVRVDPI